MSINKTSMLLSEEVIKYGKIALEKYEKYNSCREISCVKEVGKLKEDFLSALMKYKELSEDYYTITKSLEAAVAKNDNRKVAEIKNIYKNNNDFFAAHKALFKTAVFAGELTLRYFKTVAYTPDVLMICLAIPQALKLRDLKEEYLEN